VRDLILEIPPSVFHSGIFVTSRMFADYLRVQDFRGRRVAEVGTGSGILAISAAMAGASRVVALDKSRCGAGAQRNARTSGVGAIVEARQSDLFSAVAPHERYDVVISSPPSFAGEPINMTDRAWFAGEGYRHLRNLFSSAYWHLHDGRHMLVLLSSDTNIALLKFWAREAGFSWQEVARKSIWASRSICIA
jgi:release factor glutamine methyltransferase